MIVNMAERLFREIGYRKTTVADIARWLVPGGYLVIVTVPLDGEAVRGEFLGYPVETTSFTPQALAERVQDAGLQILDTGSESFQPDQPGAAAEDHLLIVARRPGP